MLVDGKLLLFLMRAHTKDPNSAMGFDTDGWAAVLIDNLGSRSRPLAAAPARRSPKRFPCPGRFGERRERRSALCRVQRRRRFARRVSRSLALADAAAGDLARPEWWAGAEGGWVEQAKAHMSCPRHSSSKGKPNSRSTFLAELDCFLQFQFEGFPQIADRLSYGQVFDRAVVASCDHVIGRKKCKAKIAA